MRQQKQQRMLDPRMKPIKSFGGSLLGNSNPKTKRPISTKRAMHIIMRSQLAKGLHSMLRPHNMRRIDEILREESKRWGISICDFANTGNHLHLVVRVKSRYTFAAFLRAVSGRIAMLVLGGKKGDAARKKFWDQRPFTRVIEWIKGYRVLKDFRVLDHLVAMGVILSKKRAFFSTA
jgi:REP element-mobilizing transposase RayT